MFDQVLIRPEALPWFQGDVRIVTRIGETDLADGDGCPNQDIGSDHFPRLSARCRTLNEEFSNVYGNA
jgi:hypothetical protein